MLKIITTEGGFFIGYNHKLGLEKALVAGRGLNLLIYAIVMEYYNSLSMSARYAFSSTLLALFLLVPILSCRRLYSPAVVFSLALSCIGLMIVS